MAMQFVLGSRSPRRRELLESFVGVERLLVRPPANSDEEGFDDLHHPLLVALYCWAELGHGKSCAIGVV